MENGECRLKFARRWVSLNTRANLLGALPGLDVYDGADLYLAVSCGRYYLTGEKCSDQTVHNDIEVGDGRNPERFVLVLGQSLYLC